jgi:5-methylcytosine-specific restriction endonuclease McrA
MFEYFHFKPLWFKHVSKHIKADTSFQAQDIFDHWAHIFMDKAFSFFEVQLEWHYESCVRAFNIQRGKAWIPIIDDEDGSDQEDYRTFRQEYGIPRHVNILRSVDTYYRKWRVEHRMMLWDDGWDLVAKEELAKNPAHPELILDHLWFNRVTQRDSENPDALRKMPYPEYLKTTHWRRIRAAVLLLNFGKCQRCGTGTWENTSKRHVHHLTYARRGQEQLADLEMLCDNCHSAEHGLFK